MSAGPGSYRDTQPPSHGWTPTALETIVRRRRVAVLRGFAERWPARRQWTFDTLAHDRPDLPAAAMRTERGVLRPDDRLGFVSTPTTVGAFVARVRAGEPDVGYLFAGLEGLPEDLLRALEPPSTWRRASFRRGKLWMSPAGVVTPLHVDASDNLHVQLRGRKIFRTCAPGNWRHLYPCAPWSGTPNFSRVDAEHPDLARHPAFRNVRMEVHELDDGDAIYLPSGHWHHVHSLEESVSVNFWWADGALALASRATDAWKRWRGLGR